MRAFTTPYKLNSPRKQRDILDRGVWPSDATPPKIGAGVGADTLLQVATRLREEGLKKLEDDPASALIAVRQAFQIQQQYGSHAGDLCAACAAVCRAQRKLAAPHAPTGAVDTICTALDVLEAWRARGQEVGVEIDFLWQELWGLSRQLSAPHPSGGPSTESLRSADRCLERIAAVAEHQPLLIDTHGGLGPREREVKLAPEEILFQQADLAQRIAEIHLAQSRGAPLDLRRRDRDAATFFLIRAARKLQLAGMAERDPLLIEIRARIADAELEQPAAQNDASPLRTQAKGEADHAKGDAASGGGGLTGGEAAGAEAGCVVC